jgi:hypothetical protein
MGVHLRTLRYLPSANLGEVEIQLGNHFIGPGKHVRAGGSLVFVVALVSTVYLTRLQQMKLRRPAELDWMGSAPTNYAGKHHRTAALRTGSPERARKGARLGP